jgi:hypothetical protein
MPMEELPKTIILQCPRHGCKSTGVYLAAPSVAVGFGSGSLSTGLEEIWVCLGCKQPFILTKSN